MRFHGSRIQHSQKLELRGGKKIRPIEMLLLLANLLTFFVLTVPLPRAIFWMRYSSPVTLLIAVVQVLLEGSRWQMFPAYALSGLFFLVWLLQNFAASSGTVGQSLTYWLAALLSVFGLVVSVVLPIILPVFHFSQPSGTYPIGTLTYHWLDAARQEVFSTDPKARRELMVQIWYPAKDTTSSSRAPYVQDANALSTALARLKHLPEFFFAQFKYVTTNAIASAPVADDKPNYPVLIFLEGAIGFRQMNTFQVEELVSHGYIVAAIDQPYTAASVVFPDGHEASALPLEQMMPLIHQGYSPAAKAPTLNGRTLEKGIIGYLAQDVRFALNQLAALNRADPNAILTGRLDLGHIGTFGVSLGGIVAAEACRLEPRVRACLVMDAPMPTDVVRFGLQQPTMWITRDAQTMRLERRRSGGWSELDISEHLSTMRATFEHLRGDGYFVQVPGMFHVNLTDIPYWSPIFSWLGITGPIDGRRAYSMINAYSLAFFDQYLKGRSAAPLENLAQQFPEVLLETRRP
jgi:pimeloyl-ACP methyl ester carboxylesterase